MDLHGAYGPAFADELHREATTDADPLPTGGSPLLHLDRMYAPTLPRLIIVHSRLSPDAWSDRVRAAHLAERTMRAVARRLDRGLSLNQAIAQLVPSTRRSWVIRHWPTYRRDGFEALIDARLPREPKLTRACREAVQAARLANPKLRIAEALTILLRLRITPLPSESTLRTLFAEVDSRRRYADRK